MGIVVKPMGFVVKGRHRMAQPVKCRGREYLRIIYGPEYTQPANLQRLRKRGLGVKCSLADPSPAAHEGTGTVLKDSGVRMRPHLHFDFRVHHHTTSEFRWKPGQALTPGSCVPAHRIGRRPSWSAG